MEIEAVDIKSENIKDEYYSEEEVQIEAESKNEPDISGKPFRCGVCGHCTNSDILLKLHMKMHLLKRIHQCNICKKCFSFVTELNNHMQLHIQERSYQSLLKAVDSPKVPGSQTSQEKPKKQFKNKNPNLPLSEPEKSLLVEHVEKIGINIKYKELEQLKSFLRNSWMKMVEIFAENDYDRSADKLARTYFHMKNQAKMHIERFYIHRKLPRPRKIDYFFVRLCPSEFEGLALDMKELQEDSKIFDQESSKEDVLDEEEKIEENGLLPIESGEETELILANPTISLDSQPSTSQKRTNSDESDLPPHKILKTTEDEDIKSLKISLLLSENKRKEIEHDLEVKKKQLDLRCREELHKKEMEIKNMELILLTQKIQQQRMQPKI